MHAISLMLGTHEQLPCGSAAAKPGNVLKIVSATFFTLGLSGCGLTGPVLQHSSGDLIHLAPTRMDSLSCGHDLSTYATQAQLTCQREGYKATKVRHIQKSKNEACLDKVVEATYKCE